MHVPAHAHTPSWVVAFVASLSPCAHAWVPLQALVEGALQEAARARSEAEAAWAVVATHRAEAAQLAKGQGLAQLRAQVCEGFGQHHDGLPKRGHMEEGAGAVSRPLMRPFFAVGIAGAAVTRTG